MLVINKVWQIRNLFDSEMLKDYTDSDIEQILEYWNQRKTEFHFTPGHILAWKKFENYIEAVRFLEKLPLDDEIFSRAEGLEPAKQILDEEGYIYMSSESGDILVLV